jgi:hypothetical protein
MPCRIGITTDPEGMRDYWQSRVTGFTNWEILNMFRSEAAAKEYETGYALRNECEATLGAADGPRTARESKTQYDWWYVYHFDYAAEKPLSDAEQAAVKDPAAWPSPRLIRYC